MSYSLAPYMGTGALVNFPVPFPYIDKTHVQVYVAGVLKALTTDYTWTSTTNVQMIVAPGAGAAVLIKRATPAATRLVDFQDAAVLTEADLDLSATQLLYVAQEAFDASAAGLLLTVADVFDARGKRITNAADPINAADVATQGWVTTTGAAPAIAAKDLALSYAAAASDSAAYSATQASLAASSAASSATLAIAAASSATSALSSSTTVAALANIAWAGFAITDGELVVSTTDVSTSTPSMVDGEFILTY